ncbi:MAG TPA: hypothetical protein VK395_19615 [Gemmataceae bacterium]|nr:hypothetical protein [Gemmataceae bacterium]
MERFVNPARCCSREYVFRGRKKLPAESGQPVAVEMKYMCKACGHVRRETREDAAEQVDPTP